MIARKITARPITARSLLARAIQASGTPSPTPPPSCSITLTGDAAAAFGVPSTDIDGQSFSVTNVGANLYLASTAIPGGNRALPSSGRVWIKSADLVSDSSATTAVGIVGFDGGGSAAAYLSVLRNPAGTYDLVAEAPAGNEVGRVSTVSGVFLGVTSAGEPCITTDGPTVTEGDSIAAAFSGLFSTSVALGILCNNSVSASGQSASGRAVTSQDDSAWNIQLPTSDEDWCGNTIVEQ